MAAIIETTDAIDDAGLYGYPGYAERTYHLAPGDTFHGELYARGYSQDDGDLIFIDAQIGVDYWLEVTPADEWQRLGGYGMRLQLLDGEGELLWTFTNGTPQFNVQTPGLRAIALMPLSLYNGGYYGPYTVTLHAEHEPSTLHTPLRATVGEAFTASIDFEGDRDAFGIELEAGVGYYVTTDAPEGYNASARFLDETLPNGTPDADGLSYVELSGAATRPDLPFLEEVTATVHAEIGGTYASRTRLAAGETLVSRIDYRNDRDVVHIDVEEGYGAFVYVEGIGDDPVDRPRFWPQEGSPDGYAQVRHFNIAGAGAEISKPGVALWVAESYGSVVEPGGYRIAALFDHLESAETAAVLRDGEALAASGVSSSDHDWFRLEVEEGVDYVVHLFSDARDGTPAGTMRMQLVDEAGAQLVYGGSAYRHHEMAVTDQAAGDAWVDASTDWGDYRALVWEDVAQTARTASTLDVGETATEKVHRWDDQDWRRIEATGRLRLTLALDPGLDFRGKGIPRHLSVVNAEGETVATSEIRDGVETLTWFAPDAEPLFAKVEPPARGLSSADLEALQETTGGYGYELSLMRINHRIFDRPEDVEDGTAGEDYYELTQKGDETDLGDGDDVAYGRGGRDVIRGGDGDDTLFGGGGRDSIDGGAGDDEIHAGGGRDRVTSGPGDDVVFLDGGADRFLDQRVTDGSATVWGGKGADLIKGGDGDDLFRGEAGRDRLFGGDGADALIGGGGPDILRGGAGDDSLSGGGGRDRLRGEAGDDRLEGGGGRDRFEFFKGFDEDLIVDFELGRDTLVIDRDLLDMELKANEVAGAYGFSVIGNTTLSFPDGGRIVIWGVANHQDLAGDVILV